MEASLDNYLKYVEFFYPKINFSREIIHDEKNIMDGKVDIIRETLSHRFCAGQKVQMCVFPLEG